MSRREMKRVASPFFAPKPPRSNIVTTPGGHISNVKDEDESPKSSVSGAAFNLINSIVGAGIVGIPFAISQCSLVFGFMLVNTFALLTAKSLKLLIETAKHIDVSSYERLAEASFGNLGFKFISFSMFIMAYGAMLGYMIIIKTNLALLLGVDSDNVELTRAILIVSSFCIILPLSLQRDMSNLSKTSTISVVFDIMLVVIVAVYSPVSESINDAGGISVILKNSTPQLSTFFTGIGVLCFAFVCQHSAFIIAASLEKPTKARWNKVTNIALGTCAMLASVMGTFGYLAFLNDTDGDIIVNLGRASLIFGESFQRAVNVARALLCTTMFFVYPMELFVARHVLVVLLFKGRRAHEGDDHSVLARNDRRVIVTMVLYIISVVPAALFDDLGSVFSVTGSLGGSALSYIGPGLTYLAVHGSEFLELASKHWNYAQLRKEPYRAISSRQSLHPIDIESSEDLDQPSNKNVVRRFLDCVLWYILIMPLWVKVATIGRDNMQKHREDEMLKSPMPFSLGKIVHHKRSDGRKLMRPMQNPSYGDSDTEEKKPLIRTLSSPQIVNVGRAGKKLISDTYIKLPPLAPIRKAKVGFSLGASHSVANERIQLDRSNPISPDSFSAASFEVHREQNDYGSTKKSSLQQEVKQLRLESGTDFSAADESLCSNRSITDIDEALTFGEDGESQSQGSSIFVDENEDISSQHSGVSSIHVDGFKSVKTARQRTIVESRIPKQISLDEVKAHPSVKKRLSERSDFVSITVGGEEDEEEDPQSNILLIDFVVAIFYVVFGVVAAFAGLYSSFF